MSGPSKDYVPMEIRAQITVPELARIQEVQKTLVSALRTLRTEYFVAGGEMTTIEACTLIDAAIAKAGA